MFVYQDDDDLYRASRKATLAETFLDSHPILEACDIYRWLWEGEFGPGSRPPPATMERLTLDIRAARMHPLAPQLPVWQELGLAQTLIQVNLVPYSDTGCPFKRLLMLMERVRDIKPDAMRFKQDWAFMKTEIVPGMGITIDSVSQFEADIPFHLVPEVEYSSVFRETYGAGYRIVPRGLFFQYFPEYEV